MPPKQPAAGGSMLHTIFQYLKVRGEIPTEFRNMTAMNKFMKSDVYKDIHSEFMTHHLSMIDHDPFQNIEDTQMLGEKKRSLMFKELCTLINSFFGLSQKVLPIFRLQNLTVAELLDEDNTDCYIMQVTWNRETKQTMINLKGDARLLRLYRRHIKVCDDEDLQKDEYDDQFSGLLFFIGGVNMGQALYLKTAVEILPLHADQLFNIGEDGDGCCQFIEKTSRNPKLVKSIQAVYRVLLTGKQGVVEQLVSPYNLWVPASPL
eukprot:scaffold6199_cov77-Attheya_sp.AAC.1